MIELERTYLLKYIPKGLETCEFKEVYDIYLPTQSKHPSLRIRKNGTKYEITKKEPIKKGDSSIQNEQTIILTDKEFEELAQIQGKRVHKKRYYYNYKNHILEIDVFRDKFKGLILVDVEFETESDKEDFEMPEFCLAEVTQEVFIAGGMLCGKSYEDIESELAMFDYEKKILKQNL